MSVEAAPDLSIHASETQEFFGASSTGKIGMWIFLLSDAFSFVGLLLGYGMLRNGSQVWHHPGEPELSVNFAALLTIVLVSSSMSMVMALTAAVERNRSQLLFFLGLTILGGVLFLAGQAHEYRVLMHEGLIFGHSAYASTFYVITSFHGLHVFTGVVYMLFIFFRGVRGRYDHGDYREVELVDLFWHFVDLVWVFVFTFVYLIPSHPGT
jgi:heme/copper-type cytochrome/quinol oxidase subunit 3